MIRILTWFDDKLNILLTNLENKDHYRTAGILWRKVLKPLETMILNLY